MSAHKDRTVVEAVQLEQGYARRTILKGFDVQLTIGVWGLLGPNGAGKTTALRTLSTAVPPWSGRLDVAGVRVANEETARVARERIGYLPQVSAFPTRYTVTDFVTYVAWTKRLSNDAASRRVPRCIEAVGLTAQAHTRLGALSGGMLQRAGIAQSLVNDPEFLILDEPTAGLDPRQRLDFRRLVAGLENKAIILSTHLVEDVISVCTHVLIMDEGEITYRGTPAQLEAIGRQYPGEGSDAERGYLAVLDRRAARPQAAPAP